MFMYIIIMPSEPPPTDLLTIFKVSTTDTSVKIGYNLTGYTGTSQFVNINFYVNDNTRSDDEYVNSTIVAIPENGIASGVLLLTGLTSQKTYSVTAQTQSTFSTPIIVELRDESLNKPILMVESVDSHSDTETSGNDATATLRARWIENVFDDLKVKNITVMYKTKTTNIQTKGFTNISAIVDTENEGYVYFDFTIDNLITNESYECSVITTNDVASSEISHMIIVSVDSVLSAVRNLTLTQSADLGTLIANFVRPINSDELTSLGELKFPDTYGVDSRTYLLVELMDGLNVLDQKTIYRSAFSDDMIVDFDLIDKTKYNFVHKPSFKARVTSSSKKVVNDALSLGFIADKKASETIHLQGIFADRMVTPIASYQLSKNIDDSGIDVTVQLFPNNVDPDIVAAFKEAYGGVLSVIIKAVDQSSSTPLTSLVVDLDMDTLTGKITLPSTWYNRDVAIKMQSKVVSGLEDEHTNPEIQIIAPFEVKINPKVTSVSATLQHASDKPHPNNPTGILLEWVVNTFGFSLTNFRITSAEKPNWYIEVTDTTSRSFTVPSADLVYGADYTFKVEANYISSNNASTSASIRFGSEVNVFKASADLLNLVSTTNENGQVRVNVPTTYDDVIQTYAASGQGYYLDNRTTANNVSAILKIGSVATTVTGGTLLVPTSHTPKVLTTVQFSHVAQGITFSSDEITVDRVVMTSISAELTYQSLGLPDDPNGISVSWDQATFAQTITSFTITCDEAPTSWSQSVAGTESSYVVTSFGTTSLVLGDSYTFNVEANYNSTVSNTVSMDNSIQYGYVLPVFTSNLSSTATISPKNNALEISRNIAIDLLSVNPTDYFNVTLGDIKAKVWVTASATQSGAADFDGELSTYTKSGLTNGTTYNVFIQLYVVVQGRRFESDIAQVTVVGVENIPTAGVITLVGSPSMSYSLGSTTVSQQINTNGLILDKYTYLAVPTDAMLSNPGFIITSTFSNGIIDNAMWSGENLTGTGTFSLTISGNYTSSAVIVFVTAALGDSNDGQAILFGSL